MSMGQSQVPIFVFDIFLYYLILFYIVLYHLILYYIVRVLILSKWIQSPAGLRGLQLHSVAQKADQESGTVQFLGSKFGRPSRSDLGSK